MTFEKLQFSRRFPPLTCAVFVIHDKPGTKYRGSAAAIVLQDGRMYVGTSICSPQDQFVKKLGRIKAVGRAAKHAVKRSDQHYCLVGDLQWIQQNYPDNTKAIIELLFEKLELDKINQHLSMA